MIKGDSHTKRWIGLITGLITVGIKIFNCATDGIKWCNAMKRNIITQTNVKVNLVMSKSEQNYLVLFIYYFAITILLEMRYSET